MTAALLITAGILWAIAIPVVGVVNRRDLFDDQSTWQRINVALRVIVLAAAAPIGFWLGRALTDLIGGWLS